MLRIVCFFIFGVLCTRFFVVAAPHRPAPVQDCRRVPPRKKHTDVDALAAKTRRILPRIPRLSFCIAGLLFGSAGLKQTNKIQALEEQNLFFIQNSQETEHALDELKQNFGKVQKTMDTKTQVQGRSFMEREPIFWCYFSFFVYL